MHFLSLEIILQCGAGDYASYVRFGETKDKYFNRSLRHGTEICVLIRFGTYQFHRYRCRVGTGFRYPTLVISWCWSTVFSEVHSQHSHLAGNFRALHASFCWQALWRCWFHFPAGLGTCPHCQRYKKLVQWPWCYCAWLASKLAWPEPHRKSMGYYQEEDERHQTQQCRWPEGHSQRNLGFHTTSAVPQTDHLHATAKLMQ